MARFLPCLLLLILSPLLFSSSGRDDSYITYWPAHVLASGDGIRNYNSEPIEQSSSLLHVAVLATAARLLPLSIPSIAPLLSLCFGTITVFLTYRLAFLLYPSAALPAALLTAFSSSLLYWSIAGMESTLAACAALCLLLASHRFLWTSDRGWAAVVVATAAFLAVRPENVFVLAGTYALFTALSWGRPTTARADRAFARALGACAGLGLVLVATLVAFRLLYFQSIVPQPVYAKANGISLDRIRDGLTYLSDNALLRPTALLWVLFVAAVCRIVWRAPAFDVKPPFDVFVSCFIVANAGVIVGAGGDWMEGGRFLLPLLPPLIAVTSASVWDGRSLRTALATTLMLASLQLLDTALLFRSPQNWGGPLWHNIGRGGDEHFSWFERANTLHAGMTGLITALDDVIDTVRVRKHGAAVSILTGQMGIVPYHVSFRHRGEVRWTDRFGLVDRAVTTCHATHDLPHTAKGIMMPYERFFERRNAIRSDCDFADPDIIFDRSEDETFAALLSQNGYVVAFREKKRWQQWIAVRGDLAGGLPEATIAE